MYFCQTSFHLFLNPGLAGLHVMSEKPDPVRVRSSTLRMEADCEQALLGNRVKLFVRSSFSSHSRTWCLFLSFLSSVLCLPYCVVCTRIHWVPAADVTSLQLPHRFNLRPLIRDSKEVKREKGVLYSRSVQEHDGVDLVWSSTVNIMRYKLRMERWIIASICQTFNHCCAC